MVISSKENETIKEIKKLKEKKFRTNKYIVEGVKMLEEAVAENQEIELVVLRENVNLDFDISNYKTIIVTENIFNTLTDVETPQGVLAIIRKQEKKEIDKKADYILALDGVQDPGNMGTIIRTADSANIKQILVSKNTVDCYSPKVVRSTMGAIYRVNVVEVEDLKDTITSLKGDGFESIVTALDAKESIYDVDYNKKIVVIGNEANGVSKEVQEIADKKVKIPMLGKTESLNASVATGIMIYEFVRQKLNKNIWFTNQNRVSKRILYFDASYAPNKGKSSDKDHLYSASLSSSGKVNQ